MNSKMIAIIAVVAMCGAALVGVGYAYTSSFTDSGSGEVGAEYVDITGSWQTIDNSSVFKYDTVKEGNTDSKQTLDLSNTDTYDTVWTVKQVGGDVVAEIEFGTITFEPRGTASAVALNDIDVKIGGVSSTLNSLSENKSTTIIVSSESSLDEGVEKSSKVTGDNTKIIIVATQSGNNMSLEFSVQITLGVGTVSGHKATIDEVNVLNEGWEAISAEYTSPASS